MAAVNIPIYRQDYALSGESPSHQYAGIEPNVFSPSLSGVALTSSTDANWIGGQDNPTYGGSADAPLYGADDFKDHKTLFIFQNTGVAASVTFAAGNTYAGREVKDMVIGAGETCAIWLDSSKFADKTDGVIKVTVNTASVKAYGVEMR